VWYQAPAFGGNQSTLGALQFLTTLSMGDLRRGRVVGVQQIGEDVRIDVEV
jgi:hypothetical protein